MDRGMALRRRVLELAGDLGLACAFDQVAAERGWRGDESGAESESRVRRPDAVRRWPGYADGRLMSGLAVTPISTTEAVVVSLREKILDGAIEPGTPLPEAGSHRASSASPARRCARPSRRCATKACSQRERNRSAFVPLMTSEEVRVPLQRPHPDRVPDRARVCSRAKRRSRACTPRSRRSPRCGSDSRWSEVVDADMALSTKHSSHAAGSPRLERLYASMSGEIRLCIAQLRPRWASPAAMGEEHRDLLAVIESRRRGGGRGAHARAPRPRPSRFDGLMPPRRVITTGHRNRLQASSRSEAPGSPCHAASRMLSSASTSNPRGLLSISRLNLNEDSAIPRRSSWAIPISASEAGRPIRCPSACTCSTALPGDCITRASSARSWGGRDG